MSNPSDSENEMHRRVDWLKPSDRVIVAELAEYGGWMKPATMALNIPYTNRHISRRCKILAENGLLERHEDTAGYRVTDLGQDFLSDNLEADDLQLTDDDPE